MFRIVLILLAVFMFFPSAYAHGFSNMGEDCSKCHTLTKDEATTLVKGLNPVLSVVDIQPSPVKGFWEITIATGAQKVLAYVDFSKRYMLSGELLDTKEKKNLTHDRLTEINKVDVSKIPLDDAIVMGNVKAPYKIIVFSDPKCPFCAKLHAELKKVIAKRKDIAFFIKMFPLPMHKGADQVSKAVICAKSLELLDDAFAGKEIPPAKCETTAVDESMKLGSSLGINGTPAIIFPDGRLIPGFMEADALIKEAEKK